MTRRSSPPRNERILAISCDRAAPPAASSADARSGSPVAVALQLVHVRVPQRKPDRSHSSSASLPSGTAPSTGTQQTHVRTRQRQRRRAPRAPRQRAARFGNDLGFGRRVALGVVEQRGGKPARSDIALSCWVAHVALCGVNHAAVSDVQPLQSAGPPTWRAATSARCKSKSRIWCARAGGAE